MKGDGGGAAVGMPILAMRTALPCQREAVALQEPFDLPRLQNGDGAHELRDLNRVRANELRFEAGLPILQEQFDHLPEVGEQLVHGSTLRMGARPARNVPDEQAGICVALDDGGECAHRTHYSLDQPNNTTLSSGLTSAWSWRALRGSVSSKDWRPCRTEEMMIRCGGQVARSSSADR